jgi:hypothetical protein
VERYARILISSSPTLAFEGGKYVRKVNQGAFWGVKFEYKIK